MTTYKDTLDWLFSQLPVFQRDGAQAYKANLDNTLALDLYFNHPHKAYKTIHIAGTNGKGSTSHMLASVLKESGYRIGLYTSPHLKDFSERILVDGIPVTEEFVINFVKQHKEIITKLRPSFFEITVAMAFLYFKESKVDFAVIETGMGGRLDSTNIIQPELSIITNISKDHAAFLGSDDSTIAKEKAGIIKQKTPVVIGRKDPSYSFVFTDRAKELESAIFFAEDIFNINTKDIQGALTVGLSGKVPTAQKQANIEIASPLLGFYQSENIRTVLTASDLLFNRGIIKDSTVIKNGIERTQRNFPIRGRWEILTNNPLTICDTGHNKDGITMVMQQLSNLNKNKCHIVWGMANDKDIEEIMDLMPQTAHYYLCAANLPRAMKTDTLSSFFKRRGLSYSSYNSCSKALEAAQKAYNENDVIFVGGSTFVVAELID